MSSRTIAFRPEAFADVAQACAASAGGKETLAHAAKISTGGLPVVLIGEEQIFTF